MKLVKACIAMAAFAALYVVPSMASATVLDVPTGTAAAVGSTIVGTNINHAETPTVTRMTTNVGSIECTTAELSGQITKNGAVVEGDIETVTFTGTAGVKPHTTHCSGNGIIGNEVIVTPDHTNPVIHNNIKSLPWCVKASEGGVTVTGGECGKPRALTFKLHGNVTCSYEKASVTGTYTKHPAQAIATIKDQEFKEIPATSSIFCPDVGKLDMAFTLENGSGQAAYLTG